MDATVFALVVLWLACVVGFVFRLRAVINAKREIARIVRLRSGRF